MKKITEYDFKYAYTKDDISVYAFTEKKNNDSYCFVIDWINKFNLVNLTINIISSTGLILFNQTFYSIRIEEAINRTNAFLGNGRMGEQMTDNYEQHKPITNNI